jgi:hypothetical protein
MLYLRHLRIESRRPGILLHTVPAIFLEDEGHASSRHCVHILHFSGQHLPQSSLVYAFTRELVCLIPAVSVTLSVFLMVGFRSLVPAPKCPAAIGLPSLITGTASNIITDLLLILIPVTLFKSLMLVRREYVAIAFVVSLGSVSIISAGIRFMLYWEILLSKNIATVSVDGMVLWTNVDIALALAAVCLPAFRVLLRAREKKVPVARRWSKRPPIRGVESSGDTSSDGESRVELRDISAGSGMSALSNDEVVH